MTHASNTIPNTHGKLNQNDICIAPMADIAFHFMLFKRASGVASHIGRVNPAQIPCFRKAAF